MTTGGDCWVTGDIKTFKLSTDPAFVEKLTDVVGLYLNPPEKAVVLWVDEKSESRPSAAHSRACRWNRAAVR